MGMLTRALQQPLEIVRIGTFDPGWVKLYVVAVGEQQIGGRRTGSNEFARQLAQPREGDAQVVLRARRRFGGPEERHEQLTAVGKLVLDAEIRQQAKLLARAHGDGLSACIDHEASAEKTAWVGTHIQSRDNRTVIQWVNIRLSY